MQDNLTKGVLDFVKPLSTKIICHFKNLPKIVKIRDFKSADEQSITWIKHYVGATGTSKILLPRKIIDCKSRFIIIDDRLQVDNDIITDQILVFCHNPKYVVAQLINKFFTPLKIAQIHETAIIHPEADITETAYIGAYCVIGKCKIGGNTVIEPHTVIYDGVEIGDNCIINANCVIGGEGSAYAIDNEGKNYKFRHVGGLIIEDNVEIGLNSYVNRGSLSDTILKENCKIGNSVCIGHNVKIGNNSIVIANTVIAGSSTIGDDVYISMNVCVRNGIDIDNNAYVGMGAVVTKHIAKEDTVYGNPAKSSKTFNHTKN